MALSKSVDFEQARQKARDAQSRAFARQRAKQADPAYQATQREKEAARVERQIQRRQAKLADPAYQAAQRLKLEEKQAAKLAAPKVKPKAKPKAAPVKSTSSRGMKGRTPTADEQRVMDRIGALPCLCCLRAGRTNPVISLHHVTGRTEPGAHYRTLPLCIWHHDTPADAAALQQYPDLIPRHAKGSLGGRAAWERKFGAEVAMLVDAWHMAGLGDRIPELLGSLTDRAANLGYFTHPNSIV